MPPHAVRYIIPEKSWGELLQHAHHWKSLSRHGLSTTLHHFCLFTDDLGTDRMLALGCSGQCFEQTVYTAPLVREPSSVITLMLSPYRVGKNFPKGPPPAELAALCERQRTPIASGISSYKFHKRSRSLLYSDSVRLCLSKQDEEFYEIGKSVEGCPLNAEICPCDPRFVAFAANRNVHIDCCGKIIYETVAAENITNGCSSYIMQEELDRFTGLWWSPGEERFLLYEKVDESDVAEVQFSSPGHSPSAPMRYPLAGTNNAVSKLRLISIKGASPNFKVEDCGLTVELERIFPWYEYLARVGWLPDGSAVWALLLSRLQNQYALILIPKGLFAPSVWEADGRIVVLMERRTRGWFSVDNLTYFFAPENNVISFIHTNGKTDTTHISHYAVTLDRDLNVSSTAEMVVTSGDWCVIKEAGLHVDPVRNHVYFVSNKHHPADLNLCVASYKFSGDSKILTELGLSYRVERTECEIQLDENIGFVCWESSVTVLPRCCFYRLVHMTGKCLPDAVLQHIIQLPSSSLLNEQAVITQKNDCPRILAYQSENSGYIHYALLLRPMNFIEGTCYPVIQIVYGGPGVQLVRNSWSDWTNCLKFTSLGYAVVMVDGRGSANRGFLFESAINRKLGTVEVDDQVEGLREVANMTGNLLDLDRVAVMGWSYGGYVALLALAKYPHVYRAAAVGGAVVCWHLYDTAYTERYLGMPSSPNYENSSVLSYISKLPNEEDRLLVVQGMIDENVHFSHTEKLIEALTAAGKPYRFQVFPSERHGVRSPEASDFHDALVLSFLQKALSSFKH